MKSLVLAAAVIILTTWLIFTPDGIMGKLTAVGYAVCHQIASRSFSIGEHPLPLCARCTGMFLGALLGISFQAFFGRRGRLPGRLASVIFVVFALSFAFDGLNSYLHLFPGLPGLYAPQNYLRLFTGTGMGLGLSSILAPIYNQTVWYDWIPEPVFAGWKPVLSLVAMAGIMDAAILTGSPVILYPAAFLSILGILVMLSMIYAMLWVMICKADNQFTTIRQVAVFLVAGFSTALLQIAVFDLARFWLTGTWQGFNL